MGDPEAVALSSKTEELAPQKANKAELARQESEATEKVRQDAETAELHVTRMKSVAKKLAQEAKEELARREAEKAELARKETETPGWKMFPLWEAEKAELARRETEKAELVRWEAEKTELARREKEPEAEGETKAETQHRWAEEKTESKEAELKRKTVGPREKLARRITKAEELARKKAERLAEKLHMEAEKESEKIEAAEDKPKVQTIQVRKIKGVWKWVDTGAPRPIRIISKIVSNRPRMERFVHYHNDEIISTCPAQIEIDFQNAYDGEVGYYLVIDGLGHSAKILEDSDKCYKNQFLSIARRQSRSKFGNVIIIGGI